MPPITIFNRRSNSIPQDITLTGTNPDGDSLAYAIQISPTNGLLSGTVPNLTYTSTKGYQGADSFTFTVNDGITSSVPVAVSITVIPDGSIEYTFETPGNISGTTSNIVYAAPDVNAFGSWVTAGDLELYDGTLATDYGRFTDLGGGSVEAAVNDRGGSSPISFTLTIDDTVAVNLTNITFDTSYRVTLTGDSTVNWAFRTIVGGVTNNVTSGTEWTHNGGTDYQSPATASGNMALTGLTGLTDTTVTFVWEMTGSRVNTFENATLGLDDIVLNGTVSSLAISVDDFGGAVVSDGTRMALSWRTVSGATYGVKATTNLVTGSWTNIATGISGAGELISVTNSMTEGQQFFRVFLEE
jgi:hypothetical protein